VILAVGVFVPIAWRFDLLGARSASPFASVASAFDPPPGYPGYSWDRDGKSFGREELVTAAGPDHCHWGSATLLTIGWPPGSPLGPGSGLRIYIRDPNGVIGTSFRELLELHATLPSDARSIGYRHGPLEVFVSPSDQDRAIYVVAPSGAERWPRMDPLRLCA